MNYSRFIRGLFMGNSWKFVFKIVREVAKVTSYMLVNATIRAPKVRVTNLQQ